jgi:transposase
MWKQFGGLCMRIVGEQLRRLLQFYYSVLRRLREDIRRKRPELWRAGNWLLHDDNAPSHRALAAREFLAHNNVTTFPHPPYSPDLAPCDFFLFPKMKLLLKGRRFDGLEDIQRESQNVYYRIKELCIKLVIETSQYYDARSEKQ